MQPFANVSFWTLRSHEVVTPETIAGKIYKEMEEHKEWLFNEKIERALRRNLYKLLIKAAPKAIPEELTQLVKNLLEMHKILREGRI